MDKQQFRTFEEWCNKASTWLTSHPQYHERFFRAICFDSKGRICSSGSDFMRADKDGAFPVYWFWPDQNLFEAVNMARYNRIVDVHYTIIVTSKEARSGTIGKPIMTHAGDKFFPIIDNDGWVEASSIRITDYFKDRLPPYLKTFPTFEAADAFGKRWKGHPWWCIPDGYEVIKIVRGMQPYGWEYAPPG